jgi:hypothetical protein
MLAKKYAFHHKCVGNFVGSLSKFVGIVSTVNNLFFHENVLQPSALSKNSVIIDFINLSCPFVALLALNHPAP